MKSFFQDWYGLKWEQRLREEIGLYHGEVTGALKRTNPFGRKLLPKLRVLRQRILDAQLAKPSRERSA